MGEVIFTILVFFGVIAVTVVLFGGWLVVMIVRGIGHAISASRRGESLPPPRELARELTSIRCRRPGCGADNPAEARFCRRCGAEFPQAQPVRVRRVAMW